MTTVFSNSNFISSDNNNDFIIFLIEVVTYSGESQMVEVEACNSYEAQSIAAELVEDADYTMVQAIA